jgi:hypothetical protein
MFNAWNFIAYQVAWFAVILGTAWGRAWMGATVALLITAAHLWLRRERFELKLVGLSALIGLLVDSTLAMTGLVRFATAWPADFAPYWMLSLWIAFATTLNHSLRWLMCRPVAAALAGAVGGPLAYLAGAKLGALSIVAPATTLPLIAMLWTPAMIALSMMVMRAALVPAAGRMPA